MKVEKVSNHLLAVGVMTGNSLDGVDVVLSRFSDDGEIEDLSSHTIDFSQELADRLRVLRTTINDSGGEMHKALNEFGERKFLELHDAYIAVIVQAVRELERKSSDQLEGHPIDVIGLHGQTCAHLPPSVAKKSNPDNLYTVQIGNGQMLADLTQTTVVCDFRSDDLMNGGEGAPLAPMHHFHLAASARKRGHFPLAFCNAGNTGNITVISEFVDSGKLALSGWDTGPFNNYPDRLMQLERGQQCDIDGEVGSKGKVNKALLNLLFEKAVVTTDGTNFLLKSPPKSSDPQWYLMLPELLGQAPVDGEVVPFEDRLRTSEYFSAYAFVHSLTLLPANIVLPQIFAVSGGGWRNPIARQHFEQLLQGDDTLVLRQHAEDFASLWARFAKHKPVVGPSEDFGFDSRAMEARIFADAAVCRLTGKPFTGPETTGCKSATVCGIIKFPGQSAASATATVRAYLECYGSAKLTVDFNRGLEEYWSRAAAGWQARLATAHSGGR